MLQLIGPILYPGKCDFMAHPTKVQRPFFTNASCFCTYVTLDTLVCKRSFTV